MCQLTWNWTGKYRENCLWQLRSYRNRKAKKEEDLLDRFQQVKIRNTLSDIGWHWVNFLILISQKKVSLGTILFPILYILYNVRISFRLPPAYWKIYLYADDTAFLSAKKVLHKYNNIMLILFCDCTTINPVPTE